KTLSRAVADGDRIRAVIRGLGISSDGRGRSLWAPRSEGQVLAVERAYPDLKELAAVDYIESQATSTQVGDATELGALASLVGRHIPSGHQIPIGSVKANIGHTLETAGLASLVKVVLAMEHGQIPPSSTCKTPNEDFDWQDGPFKLLSFMSPWQRPTEGVRTAAVNAFGIGGLNVHVALREHQPTEKRPVVQATRPDPVAIVGAGCVMPDALDRDAFFSLLDSGRSAIGSVPPERWDAERAMHVSGPKTHHITSAQGGFVQGFEYDWRRHKVPPKQIAAANPLQFMLLEAADAALADSKLLEKEFDRKRAAVIVGTLFGGEFADQLQMGLRLPETGRTLRRLLAERGVAAGDIDQIINAYEEKLLEKMPSLIDETGSFTSSTLASRLTKTFDLMGGALAFDAGKCSGVMAVQAALDMLRSGENDVVLCAAGDRYLDLTAFEDLSLVSQLATRPRSPHGTASGIIPGEGAVVLVLKRLSDAVAAGDPIRGVIRGAAMESARSPHEAMRNALNQVSEQAGVDPGFVGAVEFAGSGDPAQEQQLLEVLASTYSSNPGDGKTAPACGSLDGVVGHCGSAAGAAGLLKMTHALSRGQMPVNVGSTPDSTGGHLQVSPQQPLPIPAADANGYRAATVTVVDGQQVGPLILDNGKPLPKGSHTSPVIRKASTAEGRTCRVAALFPGQGSQYTDMFRELVAVAPEAKTAMDRMDQLSRQLGYETLSELAWRRDNALGVGIWETQWAMYLGDLFAWEVLRDMGLHVDVIASHSFGEFPSLAAAGAWTAEVGARAARCRGDAVEHVGPKDGALLSVLAPREKIEKILQSTSNQVFVCAENSADQVVVGGQRENVDAVESVLESQRMHFKRLAVPCPYHTPLLTASSSELSAGIGYLPINAPKISVFSSTTAAPMLDSIGIRESLTRQMVETVQWVRVVERLYAEGVRTFVEVGPLGVLSGLVRRILKGKTDIHIIQFDQKSESAPEVMARLRAQLAEAGALRVKKESSNHEEILGDIMHHEDKQREKQTVVAFDATEKRRARNRAGGKGKEKVTPKTTDRSVAEHVTQKVQVEPQIASTVAAPSNGAGRRSANATINGGNGHLPAGPSPTSADTAMGGSTGSRLRPTGEGDSLADILAAMYAEHGVAPPFAQSPAGSVERFWQALAEMFDLAAVDRQAVIEAVDNAALEGLLTGAGGKAEWLDAEPTHSTRQETPSVVASKPVSLTADPGQ
ncbi:MAG: beta-ketoacyl synthase N-terminal-like domain-containing protein, partial [Planctomycetota bacterium]|nr:beta-ketoacyl synthase N-terminal-like domain-containing protein [Planctomycetota bacterium]